MEMINNIWIPIKKSNKMKLINELRDKLSFETFWWIELDFSTKITQVIKKFIIIPHKFFLTLMNWIFQPWN